MTEAFLSKAMDSCGDAVYRLALCRLQSKTDAEDVFQDVFLRLYQQEKAVDWDLEHLKAWLLRVAVNRCNDYGRSRSRHKSVTLDSIPELAYQSTDEELELWDAVSRLPEKQRTVFHLYYGEGYTTKEITKILPMSQSTVRVNLNRARNLLKKELKVYD